MASWHHGIMAYAYAYACLQVEALSIRHADRRARAAARAGRDEYDHNVVLAGGIHAHAMHACILAHTRTYLRACERACMRACMHASLRACLHLYHLIYMRYIYIYIYIHMHICSACLHAYTHTVHAYMHRREPSTRYEAMECAHPARMSPHIDQQSRLARAAHA